MQIRLPFRQLGSFGQISMRFDSPHIPHRLKLASVGRFSMVLERPHIPHILRLASFGRIWLSPTPAWLLGRCVINAYGHTEARGRSRIHCSSAKAGENLHKSSWILPVASRGRAANQPSDHGRQTVVRTGNLQPRTSVRSDSLGIALTQSNGTQVDVNRR
jgi:hypothetical protein